jgi:hypothetical protein
MGDNPVSSPPAVADKDGYYLALFTFNEGRPGSVEMVEYPLSSWQVVRAYCEKILQGRSEIRWNVAEVWLCQNTDLDELDRAMVQRWEQP